MVIEKEPFRSYELDEDKKKKPMPVRLSPKDEEMLKIASYALNMQSKSGVMKQLAVWGFKNVILDGLGVEELHYLTSDQRRKLIQKKPEFRYFLQNCNTKLE